MAEFGESILYIPLRGDIADKRSAKVNLEPMFLRIKREAINLKYID